MGFDDFSDFEAPMGRPTIDVVGTLREASDQGRARVAREVSGKAAAAAERTSKIVEEVRAEERARAAADEEDRQIALEATRKRLSNLVEEPDLREVLPLRVAELLIQRAAAFPCNPLAMLGPLLVGVASIAGTRVRAQVKRGWQEPMVLWLLNIQEPSDLKTPATEVCTGPLYQLESKARSAYAKERAAAEQAGEDGEKVLLPPCRRFVVDDATYERVVQIVGEPRTHGLASMHDEVASWFTHLDRRESAARSGWLKLWSGGPAAVDRKVAQSSFATRTAVSLFGNTQPDKYAELVEQGRGNLAASGDGLFSRFLSCRPRSVPWAYNDHEVTIDREIRELLEGLDGFLASLVETAGDNTPPLVLTLSPAAKGVAREAWNRWAGEARVSNAGRAAFLGKLRGYSVRLAAVVRLLGLADARVLGDEAPFKVLQRAEHGQYQTTVDADDFRAALRLCDYYLRQFDALQGDTGGTEIPALVAKFQRKVVDKEAHEVTPRMLVQWRLRGRHTMTTAEAQQFLLSLEENYGWGTIRQDEGGRITWVAPTDLATSPSPSRGEQGGCSTFNVQRQNGGPNESDCGAGRLLVGNDVEHAAGRPEEAFNVQHHPSRVSLNAERAGEPVLNSGSTAPEGKSPLVEPLNVELPPLEESPSLVAEGPSPEPPTATIPDQSLAPGTPVDYVANDGSVQPGWRVLPWGASKGGWPHVRIEHAVLGTRRITLATQLRLAGDPLS